MKKLKLLLSTIAVGLCSVLLFTACGSNNQTTLNFTGVDDQLTALTEVKAGTSDIAVIDNVMANYYVNKPNFNDLTILGGNDFTFDSEYYAIGFRKSGNTKDYINYALYTLQQQGTITTLANKYGLTDVLSTIPAATNPGKAAAGSDFARISEAGKLVLGYTLFEPIAYLDQTTLTGFDIELAEAVCEVLDIDLECVKISWDEKEDELNSFNIDCIWNGFTYTEERAQNLDFSSYYLVNRQAIVIRTADKNKYTTYESMKSAKFTAEKESAGQETIETIITGKVFKK